MNPKITVKGDTLIIECKINNPGKASASGKSLVIASTNGNIAVPGTDLKLGVNLYKPLNATAANA